MWLSPEIKNKANTDNMLFGDARAEKRMFKTHVKPEDFPNVS
jgi:hypothetical protein